MSDRPFGYGFGEIEDTLKAGARQLLRERAPIERVHAMVAGEHGGSRAGVWDRELWGTMVDLGWSGMRAPERAEGAGLPCVAAVGVLEEVGRAAVPSPLPTSLAAACVLAACHTPEADAALSRIVAGAPATLADVGNDGVAQFVQDAAKAELLVVRESGGVHVMEAAQATMVPDRIVDLTRDQATARLEGESTPQVGPAEAWDRALPELLVYVSADMVGAAEWQLQTTAEYARARVQFDRPLGFFQAVKHPLVDTMIAIDRARTLLYDAACAVDHAPDDALVAARMAKAAACEAAALASDRSVQLHGGIGFTWECFVHVYFKRQQHSRALLGDAFHQRAQLAEVFLGPV